MSYELITGKKNLLKLIDDGVIDAISENVGACSIDVRLDNKLLIESQHPDGFYQEVDLMNGKKINTHSCIISDCGYALPPGCFVNGYLKEYIKMPDNMIGRFTLRSIVAQNGLGHALSDTIRQSWQGNLVLELTNTLKQHNWVLRENFIIGQIQFFRI